METKKAELQKTGMSRYQKLTGFSFLFIETLIWKENRKKDKIKYNHHYPTCSLSMPCYFLSEQSAKPLQTGSPVPELQYCPIRAVHGVPYVSPHCSLCLAASGKQDKQGPGLSPPCRLCRQASDEQPLALTVSLDANTDCIFCQWHFPLDIATARSSPISFIFRFFLKSHFP